MAHENAELLERFYTAFGQRDAETMAEAYHDEARFSDPAFPDLDAEGVRSMWRMLVERGTDLKIEHSGIEADDTRGKAHWDATYTFSATGRKVLNRIDAEFEFKDGKIIRHVDRFDFWTWSRQALGLPGLLMGWSGFLKKKVQSTAGSQLKKYQAKRASAS